MKQHKTSRYIRRMAAAALSAVLAAGLCACGAEKPKAENTASQAGGENTAGKKGPSAYSVTEENENTELIMNRQPESPYWFPEQLLEWSPDKDPDFAFNVSTVPLAARVDKDKLTPVNETQNKDTKVLAISIMNSSTSGNAPHGLNLFKCNTFAYWQYVDTLVYWGGSSGEGLIVAPSPDVTDMGHKNGVKVLGTCFFPQTASGGKLEWLNTLLQKDNAGSFPMVDKLVETAQAYGFDGWFMNQETEGTQDAPLTGEHAVLMQEFIKAFKEKAPDLQMIYYDSMTAEGKVDWQNALTDKNSMFLKDEKGNDVADGMFLNFWWTEDKLADQALLKASAEKAKEIGGNPYELYAGMDVQADGFATPERWDLFGDPAGGSYTSLGLYCPSWAWTASSDPIDFANKENILWVNGKGDPRAKIAYADSTQWRGVSTYVVERSALTSLPFVTNFNVGNGYNFFIKGEQASAMSWNNRSISDVLPTYRWIMENEGGNHLTPTFNMADAYYGGSSLRLHGSMDAAAATTIKLYSADLPVTEGLPFTTTAKANTSTALDLVLTLDDGSEITVAGDQKLTDSWTTVNYDLKEAAGKSIRAISYKITANEANDNYDLFLGNITIGDLSGEALTTVSDLKAADSEFDEDVMYAGCRLTWRADTPAGYYEVFRVNQDGTKSLLGVSNTTCFYVNTLPRTDETNLSNFEVVPVNKALAEGTSATASMNWPDNSLPKANFTADRTLVAPGSTVTFESKASQNTTSVEWTFEGGNPASSTDAKPAVVFDQPGTYKVTMKAKNDSGEAEKTVEGAIVVTDAAQGDLQLLSQGRPAKATAYTNENESPAKAVDGDVKTKWCATGTPPHEITIDLGDVKAVSQVTLSHAEAGGESSDMNTKAYTISVSEDGGAFTDVASASRNSAATTGDTFAPVNARYVRLSVIKPTQGSDTAARIYEIQVYGINSAIQ